MNEEWDYLIILDACRYDLFTTVNDIPGTLEMKLSGGSHTTEWLKYNFPEYYEDVIYISGNVFLSPHPPKVRSGKLRGKGEERGIRGEEKFLRVEEVWKYGWEESLGTVPPKKITDVALEMDEKFPEKKKIIHYMQPHFPFIGKPSLLMVNRSRSSLVPLLLSQPRKAREAYKGNLMFVINEVKKLVKNLKGKVVITSDHGECLGDHFLWLHAPKIYLEELVKVPWLIVDPEFTGTEIMLKKRIANKINRLKEKLRSKG